MKFKFLILATVAMFLIACEKDDGVSSTDPMEDKSAPVITFISPDTTNYMSGMTMPIKFSVTENDELHEIQLTVTDLSTSNQLMILQMHKHGQTATIDTSMVIPSGGMHRDFEIKAEASDHNGNEAIETITKHIHM